MAKPSKPKKADKIEEIPPGATQQASDRDERPGGPRHTPLDDRHATGENDDVGLVGPLEEDDFADVQEGRAVGGEIHGGLAPQQGVRNIDSTIGACLPGRKKGGKAK